MIGIIDYGVNETTDLTNALSQLSIDFIKTRNEKEIIHCDKIIISDAPNLSQAVKRMHLLNLFSLIRFLKKPTLGISLGMDLLCNKSNDGISCLGLIESEVIDDSLTEPIINIPGMRKIEIIHPNKLFFNIDNGTQFYFSNTYHTEIFASTIAVTKGESQYSAAIHKENIFGVQFIPEKSGEQGLQILKNFALNIT